MWVDISRYALWIANAGLRPDQLPHDLAIGHTAGLLWDYGTSAMKVVANSPPLVVASPLLGLTLPLTLKRPQPTLRHCKNSCPVFVPFTSSCKYARSVFFRVPRATNGDAGVGEQETEQDFESLDSNENSSSSSGPEPVQEKTRFLRKRKKSGRKARAAAADAFPAIAETKSKIEKKLEQTLADLYLGEKGILFWLNKIAYTSIFVIAGAWILFRFVGPSLGLYTLQSPLLEPTKAFD